MKIVSSISLCIFGLCCFAPALLAQDAKATAETKPASTTPDEKKEDGADSSKKTSGKAEADKTESDKTESDKTESDEKPAEEKTLAGHSYHGEVFNEGPRQKAYLMDGMAKLNFPVTSSSDEAKKFCEQGLVQLHGFWYFEAERSFRQAASLDKNCAMAYWGMSLANSNNSERAKDFIAEAVKLKDKVTEREQKYIEALERYYKTDKGKSKERGKRYVKDLEKIVYEYDDIEAKALICLQMWLNRRYQIPIVSHLAVDALIRDVLREQPMHPVHHYSIHLWDYENAERALKSATLCGQSAPGIAHMWHMPGHIFSKLKRYDDAAWQQEASARVDHAHMMRDGILPDQIHNFAHNNEWLIRNLMNLGRVHDAVDLARNMISLPRHPKYNTVSKRGSTSYGRSRLFDVLVKYEMWDQLIAWCESPWLERTDSSKEQVKRLRFLGKACFIAGYPERGAEQLALLEFRLEKVRAEKEKAESAAKTKAEGEKKKASDVKRAVSSAGKPFKARITLLERATWELQGHQHVLKKEYDEAFALFKKASGVEVELLTRIKLKAGKTDEAVKDAEKHAESKKNEVRPLASLVETLWAAGKKEDAKKHMQRLQKVGRYADLDVPALARLEPIAMAMGMDSDWRIQDTKTKTDIGERPDLDSLGPFRWQPSPAQDWKLTDSTGKDRSLADYRGKPVVVIFYLGYGCLHCAEQLQAFAPKIDDFHDQGLEVIAISTDEQVDLEKSQKSFESEDGGKKFPFPLVSNANLDVFKQYRVFDDFEQQPLHGTFLIDGDGLIRWQDISYEPFNDPDFVLKESRRLLRQSSSLAGKSSTSPSSVSQAKAAPSAATHQESSSATESAVTPAG